MRERDLAPPNGSAARLAHAVNVPFVLGTPRLARVDRDRLAQRPRERLERGLDHVVGVGAGFDAQVQRQLRGVGERAEELLCQLVLEPARRARRAAALRTA